MVEEGKVAAARVEGEMVEEETVAAENMAAVAEEDAGDGETQNEFFLLYEQKCWWQREEG